MITEELENSNQICDSLFKQRALDLNRIHAAQRRQRKLEGSKGSIGKHKRAFQAPSLEDGYVRQLYSLLAPTVCQLAEEDNWPWGRFIQIDRALLHILYAQARFESVRLSLCKIPVDLIPLELENELEELWYQSLYQIALCKGNEGQQAKQLSSVNKYRIRKRHAPPTAQRGGHKKYSISRQAYELMAAEYVNNPRPRADIKSSIARRTGLKLSTVSNWFKNRRQRNKTRASSSGSQLAPSPSVSQASEPGGQQWPAAQGAEELKPSVLAELLQQQQQQQQEYQHQQQPACQFNRPQCCQEQQQAEQNCYLDAYGSAQIKQEPLYFGQPGCEEPASYQADPFAGYTNPMDLLAECPFQAFEFPFGCQAEGGGGQLMEHEFRVD